MTTDRVGKVLERVAREASLKASSHGDDEAEIVLDAVIIQRVLEEHLLPLLRAGQAMYDMGKVQNNPTLNEILDARRAYAAALATLEGRE